MSEPGLAVCLATSFFGHYVHSGSLNALGRAGALAAGLWLAARG